MRSRPLARFTLGLLTACAFAAAFGAAAAPRVMPGASLRQDEEGTFDSLEQALRSPAKARRLAIQGGDPSIKHLPPGWGGSSTWRRWSWPAWRAS